MLQPAQRCLGLLVCGQMLAMQRLMGDWGKPTVVHPLDNCPPFIGLPITGCHRILHQLLQENHSVSQSVSQSVCQSVIRSVSQSVNLVCLRPTVCQQNDKADRVYSKQNVGKLNRTRANYTEPVELLLATIQENAMHGIWWMQKGPKQCRHLLPAHEDCNAFCSSSSTPWSRDRPALRAAAKALPCLDQAPRQPRSRKAPCHHPAHVLAHVDPHAQGRVEIALRTALKAYWHAHCCSGMLCCSCCCC